MATAPATTIHDDSTKETFFCPSWFPEHGLKGFYIKHIEAKSEHLQNLKASIKTNGYNHQEPIVVAKSKDPNTEGYVLDGRHRLIACEWVRKDTGELPNIKIVQELVKDFAHAEFRQIFYESAHLLRKNAESAAEHIIELYQDAKRRLPEIDQQKPLDDFIQKEGKFGESDKTLLMAVVTRISKFEEKQRQKDLAKMQVPRKPGDSKIDEGWTDDKKPVIDRSKQKYRSFASELETTCDCGKKSNHAVNGRLYEDGKVLLETVN